MPNIWLRNKNVNPKSIFPNTQVFRYVCRKHLGVWDSVDPNDLTILTIPLE